jgi:hypothetical protein
MPGKKKKKSRRPPCPDPEQYIWVETKEGGHWRRKRSKGTPLNRSLAANASATKIVSPVAKRIRDTLEAYTRQLDTARIQVRLSVLFRKTYIEKGQIELSALRGFEFQEDYPLEQLLLTQYQVNEGFNFIELQIPVKGGVVKKQNNLVTDFYFEGILLYGDPLTDRSFKVEYAVSKPYTFKNAATDDCKLILPLPQNNEPWMLMLKVSCLEGNEMASHVKHYGMRVVEVGGG